MNRTILFSVMIALSVILTGCKQDSKNEPPVYNSNTSQTGNQNGGQGGSQTYYQYHTYPEPCLAWGTSISSFETYMKKQGYTNIVENTDGAYAVVGGTFGLSIFFDAAFISGAYKWIDVYIKYDNATLEEVVNYLFERYTFIKNYSKTSEEYTKYNMTTLFRTKDGKTDVEIGTENINGNLYIGVYYSPL